MFRFEADGHGLLKFPDDRRTALRLLHVCASDCKVFSLLWKSRIFIIFYGLIEEIRFGEALKVTTFLAVMVKSSPV